MRFEISPLPDESHRVCTALATVAYQHAFMWGIAAVNAAVAVAAFALTPERPWPTVIFGAITSMATVVALQLDGRERVKRLFRSDPHAMETYFVELSPEGVRTGCAHLDARYPWQDFSKVAETKEFFLFVRPIGNGAAIPKRMLDTAQKNEIRVRVREWPPHFAESI